MKKPVIKIPSKDIYPPILNSKIVDNKINKIEVQAYAPQLINATENVYNERIESGFLPDNTISSYNWEAYERDRNDEIYPFSLAIAYIRVTPTYITKTYKIQKSQANNSILRLFTGKDENGNSNIKYDIRGDVEKGNLTADSLITTNKYFPVGDNYDPKFQFDSESLNKDKINEKTNIGYNFDELKDLLSTTFTHKFPYGNFIYDVTAKVTLPSKTDVFNVNAVETDTDYTLTFSILAGLLVEKFGGLNKYPHNTLDKIVDFPLSGTYEEYIPKEVNVSFYGDVLKLNLEQEQLTIGDGNNFYSYSSSNELMQVTNIPNPRAVYSIVNDKWANGKELATLRCGISDYYTVDKNIDIDVSFVYSKDVTIATDDIINIGDTLYLEYVRGSTVAKYILTVEDYIGDNKYFCTLKAQTIPIPLPLGKYNAVIKNKLISNSGEDGLPMTIHKGDIVEPYKYGADGKDKPMSLLKNGTAKNFQIIGKKVIYDGAVWQEIDMLEYNGDDNQLDIYVIGITTDEDKNYLIISIENDSTILANGNTLEYEGEKATVVYEEPLTRRYNLEYVDKGKFYKAIGKTITVTKLIYSS